MNPLDPDRLQRLLDGHQLTVSQLAEMLDLELHDVSHSVKHLPVMALAQLADLLGESPLKQPAEARGDPDRPRLGTHLAGAPNGATRDDLAYALDWTLDRLERTLSSLDTALADVGIRVVARAGRLRLIGRLEHTSSTGRQRVARSGTRAIDAEVAKAVYHLIAYGGRITGTNQTALEEARRGLVKATTWYRRSDATEPVLFSLCINERDTPWRVELAFL